MATWFYKWLAFLGLSFYTGPVPAPEAHPFHVSVTEIEHNAAEKTLEITCRFFTDDFEAALAKQFGVRTDLVNPPDRKAMDSLVSRYIRSHLQIRAFGRLLDLHYLGFEHERESVRAYLEVSGQNPPAELRLSNSFLYDSFTDQANIMHVTVGGKRQSSRVLYPDKEVVLRF